MTFNILLSEELLKTIFFIFNVCTYRSPPFFFLLVLFLSTINQVKKYPSSVLSCFTVMNRADDYSALSYLRDFILSWYG